MQLIENLISSISKTETFILSYFESIKYNSSLFNKDEQEKLISTVSSDELNKTMKLKKYELLFEILKLKSDFKSIYDLKFEMSLYKSKIKNNLDILVNSVSEIIFELSTFENDLHKKKSIFELMENENVNEIRNKMQYFIVKLINVFPEYLDDFEGAEKFALKKILCNTFKNKNGFNDTEPSHILYQKVQKYFDNNNNYYNKNIYRYQSSKNIVTFKKNRQQLFTFIKRFCYPYICKYSEIEIQRFIETINRILGNYPDKVDGNYHFYIQQSVSDIEKLINDAEKNITDFSVKSYLMILYLIKCTMENEYDNLTNDLSAAINVLKPDKKYPLQLVNESFVIDLPVYFDMGNSHAGDITIELISENGELEVEPIRHRISNLSASNDNRDFLSQFKITPKKNIKNESTLIYENKTRLDLQ